MAGKTNLTKNNKDSIIINVWYTFLYILPILVIFKEIRMSEYSCEPIEKEDLRIFADKVKEYLQSPKYRGFANIDSVKLMALCQGGGLHYAVTHGYAKRYLDPKQAGLKDVDIWIFFKREAGKENYRIRGDNDDVTDILRCYLGPSKFGRYPGENEDKGRRIDILPYSIKEFDDIADPFDAVKQWLEKGWNIIKGIKNYDVETIKKVTEDWNSKAQQNGVEMIYHSPFLATKAAIAIYPEIFLGKILWVNPEL
jgi:hypothetical protein